MTVAVPYGSERRPPYGRLRTGVTVRSGRSTVRAQCLPSNE
ncbi:hypothetical protein CU044_3399 [Streptomyces sp. L-9-10]|nr:hypothetical protein CU044_3399 [Streptomyces sp. L-9-10]